MKRLRRPWCFLLAVMLVLSLVPGQAGAAGTVYFTAINDKLLDLEDATMPFWAKDHLYISSTAVYRTDLGLSFNYRKETNTAVLYRQGKVMICDFSNGTIYDNAGGTYSGEALIRGGTVFFPVDALCRCFGFEYSYTKTAYGYLVRVKSDPGALSDAVFLDAASSLMATRYARYRKGSESPEPQPGTPAQPVTPTQPSAPVTPSPAQETPEREEPAPERTVRLLVDAGDSDDAERILAALHAAGAEATFLLRQDALDGTGDLPRRLAAGGQAIALFVETGGDAGQTIAAIERANDALWRAAMRKTRLVRLEGATQEVRDAAIAAGYCPILYSAVSGAGTVARESANILRAADSHGGRCCMHIEADSVSYRSFPALLSALKAGNASFTRLTEVNL